MYSRDKSCSKCCIVVIQLYTYTCGNKINNKDEWTHFRKIYLSHFIRNGCERVAKGLCVRGELETEQTATYWPPFPLSSVALLSRSAGLLNSPLLGAGSLYSILSPTNWLQLTEPVCGTGLYNCLTPTCFLWASHLHPIQPAHSQGYTLISSTGCTCYLHRCISYLTAQPKVNMLHKYPFLFTSCWDWTCNLKMIFTQKYFSTKHFIHCALYHARTVYRHGWNKGYSSRFCVGSQVRHEAPEESQKIYRPKRCQYNNEDENNCKNWDKCRT